MKKTVIFLVAILFLTVFAGTIYAKYKSGFVVVGKTADSVVIKSKNGEEISVPKTSKKYKIGDKVMFDVKKKKITPEIEGC